MAVRLNPYLGFRADTREAMEFYKSVFGGNLTIGTFKEMNAAQDESEADLVMHSQLETDDGLVLMASDTPSRMSYRPGDNFSISLSGQDEAKLRGWFEKLAEGGTVSMPLEKAIWGDTFGMCTDRFGINWVVNISPGQ